MENKLLQKAKDEIAKEYSTNYANLINDSVETNDIIERIAIRYNELCNAWVSVDVALPDVDNTKNTFGQRIQCLVVIKNYSKLTYL